MKIKKYLFLVITVFVLLFSFCNVKNETKAAGITSDNFTTELSQSFLVPATNSGELQTGNYYLGDDLSVNTLFIGQNQTVNINLNGYKLTFAEFKLYEGSSLSLYDLSSNKTGTAVQGQYCNYFVFCEKIHHLIFMVVLILLINIL